MFASTLKDLRARNCITQVKLAEILGVAQQTVASWEKGKSSPNYDVLKKIADFFHVDTDHLLGRYHLLGDTDDPNHPWHDYSKPDVHEYYTDPETALLAQEAHDNPDLKILFDASRKLSPKDLKTVTNLVKSLTGDEDD